MVNKVTRFTLDQSFGVGRKEFLERTPKGFRNDAELDWKFVFFLILMVCLDLVQTTLGTCPTHTCVLLSEGSCSINFFDAAMGLTRPLR